MPPKDKFYAFDELREMRVQFADFHADLAETKELVLKLFDMITFDLTAQRRGFTSQNGHGALRHVSVDLLARWVPAYLSAHTVEPLNSESGASLAKGLPVKTGSAEVALALKPFHKWLHSSGTAKVTLPRLRNMLQAAQWRMVTLYAYDGATAVRKRYWKAPKVSSV